MTDLNTSEQAQPSESGLNALVFRRSATKDPSEIGALLVVLLVGESAIQGVDAAGLWSALRLAGCERGETLAVLGPFFSGSAPAMFDLMNEARCPALIVTGSATGELHADKLARRHGLARTIVSDSALRDYLLRALAARKPRFKLAVMSESGTEYAAGFSSKRQDRASGSEADCAALDCSVRTYRFPLHIADLRSAHGSPVQTQDERLAGLRRSLTVDLSAVHPRGPDQLPVYSRLTPPSVEATLATLANLRQVGRFRLHACCSTERAEQAGLRARARAGQRRRRVVEAGRLVRRRRRAA